MALAFTSRRKTRGSLESFNHDGVEIARRKRSRRVFPLRQVMAFGVAVVAFKVFLYFDMGAMGYATKRDALAEGSALERLAAWAMQLDPVSLFVIDGIRMGFF